MLGRKDYTRKEVDDARSAIDRQLAAYTLLARAGAADGKVGTALANFEPQFFNHLTLALDRYFVHRIRNVSGRDANPLNEVEVICESLMVNDGVLVASTVLKMNPEQTVLKLQPGDRINITADQFARLSSAFFDDLERKFVS